MVFEDLELFKDQLDDLSYDHKLFYDALRRLKGNDIKLSFIKKSEEYLKSETARFERVRTSYDEFSRQVNKICDSLMNELMCIEEEDKRQIEQLSNYTKKISEEIMKKNSYIQSSSLEREPSFCYRGYTKSKMTVELVKKYPGSYMYKEYMSKRRTKDGDVYIDCNDENDEFIVKYMKDDESIIEDMKNMNFEKRSKLLNCLTFLELPVKKDYITQIGCNEDNEIMEAWRNRRIVMVNKRNITDINKQIQKQSLYDSLYSEEPLKNIHYIEKMNTFFINLNLKYLDAIDYYLKNNNKLNEKILQQYKNVTASSIIDEFRMIGIHLNKDEMKQIRMIHYEPLFMNESHIIDNTIYDQKLQEWLDYQFGWKLIYRASEHDYTASSFHEYCDNKGPTLIVIKSSVGLIFGGYTSVHWTSDSICSFDTYDE